MNIAMSFAEPSSTAIQRPVGLEGSLEGVPEAVPLVAHRRKTILLVDDQKDLRTLVRMTLEDPSLEILEAVDGDIAIEIAQREIPDLILLDWMMPGLDGLEVMASLRQNPSTANIPVIMLTSRNRDADIAESVSSGACCHLTKPFSPLQLLQTIERIL